RAGDRHPEENASQAHRPIPGLGNCEFRSHLFLECMNEHNKAACSVLCCAVPVFLSFPSPPLHDDKCMCHFLEWMVRHVPLCLTLSVITSSLSSLPSFPSISLLQVPGGEDFGPLEEHRLTSLCLSPPSFSFPPFSPPGRQVHVPLS
ncbi:unnamed protein product, partial [Closterium sp. NIES-54]